MTYNKIFAIAINDYDDAELNKINNCYSDISSVVEVLNEKYQFDDTVFLFKKEETTRKHLYNQIKSYFRDSLENENVLILYAGHGALDKETGLAYWQPSDADITDSSSWLSISDILNFIRISKAHHIALISDSCFAATIFERSRGGGIEAFNNKKSRQGLASGGLEKVSDGIEGQHSPFTEVVLKILKDNVSDNFPFNVFSLKVIELFDKERKQTPEFGDLNYTGHEGGSFIFSLKSAPIILAENDKSIPLKDKLGKLYIDLTEEVLHEVKILNDLQELKNSAVKKQKYEDAAKIRNEELQKIKEIKTSSRTVIDKIKSEIKFTNTELIKAKELNLKTELHLKQKEERRKISGKDLIRISQGSPLEYLHLFFDLSDPGKALFDAHKDSFLKIYVSGGVIELYKEFKRLIATSENIYLVEKERSLINILLLILSLEIDLIGRNYRSELDIMIHQKSIELQLLTWIQDIKAETEESKITVH